MDIAYLLGGLVLVVIMLNGVWMLINARPLISRLGRRLPKAPAAQRWIGAAQIVGSAGVITEFSLLATNSASVVGNDIGSVGLVSMFLCYGASWWVDSRARRRSISN
jgi:hypothetical protein